MYQSFVLYLSKIVKPSSDEQSHFKIVLIAFLLLTNLCAGIYIVLGSPNTSSDKVTGPPTIVGYGPKNYETGVPFNRQPTGDSAVWIKTSFGGSGTKLVIVLNGVEQKTTRFLKEQPYMLTTSVSNDLVSQGLPISLVVRDADSSLQSSPVVIR